MGRRGGIIVYSGRDDQPDQSTWEEIKTQEKVRRAEGERGTRIEREC